MKGLMNCVKLHPYNYRSESAESLLSITVPQFNRY